MRKILRWSIGPCSNLGKSALKESITKALKVFKGFEFFLGYNNIDPSNLDIDSSIKLYEQKFKDFCLPINFGIPKKENFHQKTEYISGSFHKIIPTRLDINSHEIFVDNDLIFLEMLEEIEKFLSSDKTLLCESALKFQGHYTSLFKPSEKYTSSLMGLPPGFNFKKHIKKIWEAKNELKTLNYDDEQGLFTSALNIDSPIIISCNKVVELFHNVNLNNLLNRKLCSKASAFHFVGINRNDVHQCWMQYKIGC